LTTTEVTKKTSVKKTDAKIETFEIIPLDKIGSDPSYQRYLSMNYVQSLIDQWDPRACGPLLVSRRKNGAVFVVDGQHRLEALKLRGETQAMSRVANSLTEAEEASLRIATQFVKPERAWERFKARIAARDPEAITIMKLLQTVGVKIQMEPRLLKNENMIASVRTVENLYALDKGVTLTSLINLLMDTFGEINSKNSKGLFLRAIGWFLYQHPNADKKVVVTILREEWFDLEKKARASRSSYGTASLWTAIYRQLVASYNRQPGVERFRADVRDSSYLMGTQTRTPRNRSAQHSGKVQV
jgi:hypothetical protein